MENGKEILRTRKSTISLAIFVVKRKKESYRVYISNSSKFRIDVVILKIHRRKKEYPLQNVKELFISTRTCLLDDIFFASYFFFKMSKYDFFFGVKIRLFAGLWLV
jgi:hypothetical protein